MKDRVYFSKRRHNSGSGGTATFGLRDTPEPLQQLAMKKCTTTVTKGEWETGTTHKAEGESKQHPKEGRGDSSNTQKERGEGSTQVPPKAAPPARGQGRKQHHPRERWRGRKQHHPAGGRRRQQHTKGRWDSSTNQCSNTRKERRKASRPKRSNHHSISRYFHSTFLTLLSKEEGGDGSTTQEGKATQRLLRMGQHHHSRGGGRERSTTHKNQGRTSISQKGETTASVKDIDNAKAQATEHNTNNRRPKNQRQQRLGVRTELDSTERWRSGVLHSGEKKSSWTIPQIYVPRSGNSNED